MATFLIESNNTGFHLNNLDADGLQVAKSKLREGIAKGVIKGVWAKVGGGSVWVVEGESHAKLAHRLREFNISNVTVTPVLDGAGVIDAHIAHRESQG